jgi:hypothetical protein
MELLRQKMESAVRERAYSIYQSSGATGGRDLGHWTEAEGKLISSNLEVRGSDGPWFHCNCPVPAIPADRQQIPRLPQPAVQLLDQLSQADWVFRFSSGLGDSTLTDFKDC